MEQALNEVAEEEDIELDVKQIVGSMFNRRGGLNRKAIRDKLNQNLDSMVESEPIPDQILRHLEEI